MTAVPPPVPPEIVRRFAEDFFMTNDLGTWQLQGAEESLAAVYGDIVEAARRDALGEAADRIGRLVAPRDADWHEALFRAVCIIDDLLRGHAIDATAPRTAPAATVSDQGADPRIPGTDEAQKRSEPVFPAWVLQVMDDHQQQAEARMRRLLDEEPTDD